MVDEESGECTNQEGMENRIVELPGVHAGKLAAGDEVTVVEHSRMVMLHVVMGQREPRSLVKRPQLEGPRGAVSCEIDVQFEGKIEDRKHKFAQKDSRVR